jgi:hypothetical protein
MAARRGGARVRHLHQSLQAVRIEMQNTTRPSAIAARETRYSWGM